MSMESHLPLGTRKTDLHNYAREDSQKLFDAAEKGDLIAIETLINQKGVPANVRDKTDGTQPIHLCCASGAGVKCLDFLISSFEKQQKEIMSDHQSQQQKEQDKNSNNNKNNTSGKTAIVDARDFEGFTPLMTCASHEHLQELQYLLFNQNANPYIANKFGGTVLHIAASHSSSNSQSIFHQILAATKNDPKLVNAQRRDGFTALHLAVYHGNSTIAKMLITEAGADCSLKTNTGVTALHLACGKKKEGMLHEVIRPLIEVGHASVNTRDDSGETPLHIAAAEGSFDVVQYLCERHGAILYFDKNRKSAFDFAKQNNHIDIARYLKDYATRKKEEMLAKANEEYQQQQRNSSSSVTRSRSNSNSNLGNQNQKYLHAGQGGSQSAASSRPMTPNVDHEEDLLNKFASSTNQKEKHTTTSTSSSSCNQCAENLKTLNQMASEFQKERKQWSEKVNHLKGKLEKQEKESQREIQRLKEVAEGAKNARDFEVRQLKNEIENMKQGRH